MRRVALCTDTTADLPPNLQRELGVIVSPAGSAFSDRHFQDGELSPADFFARMAEREESPRPSTLDEHGFEALFRRGLEVAPDVVCFVMPFDVTPAFTTAGVVATAVEAEVPGRVKVINPGVASAGLGALLTSLAAGVAAGWGVDEVADAVDEYAPLCDALFSPADTAWLARAGHLPLVEERLGAIEDGSVVVRVGTRITGVARENTREQALARLVETVGKRAGDRPLVAFVDHAACPQDAARLADALKSRWNVQRLVTTELSPTIGSRLGPGALGVGVAPLVKP